MSKTKNGLKKTLFLLLAVLGAGFFAFSGEASALTQDEIDAMRLRATNITRITHPCVETTNLWQGEQRGISVGGTGAWNANNTKIMWMEAQYHEGGLVVPGCNNVNGRGVVWGNLAVLKSLAGTEPYSVNMQNTYDYTTDYNGSYSDFVANTTPMPNVFKNNVNGNLLPYPPLWSIVPGEEDIIYGLQRLSNSQLRLWKYDTSQAKDANNPVIIFTLTDPQSNISNIPMLWGWKRGTTNFYIIVNEQHEADANWRGWEIDPTGMPKATYFTGKYSNGKCSGEGLNRPWSGIHTGRSPDGRFVAQYGEEEGVSNCESWIYGDMEYYDTYWKNLDHFPVHAAWFNNSNDYYMAGDPGYKGTNPAVPWIATYRIYQIFFDGDYAINNCVADGSPCPGAYNHNEVLQFKGAGRWGDANYHNAIIPTLRTDGQQLLFFSTNKINSISDKYYIPSTPIYSGRGMFVADLTSASGDTTPPAAPTGVTVE